MNPSQSEKQKESRRWANPENSISEPEGKTMAPPPLDLQASDEKSTPEAQSGEKVIPSVVLKRKNIKLFEDDKYGHWWTEINGKESYGWWPKEGATPMQAFQGVEGELNGQTYFGGGPTFDPYHGSSAETELSVKSKDPNADEASIHQKLRSFAQSYSGDWQWAFGEGQNCRSFQLDMIRNAGLEEA